MPDGLPDLSEGTVPSTSRPSSPGTVTVRELGVSGSTSAAAAHAPGDHQRCVIYSESRVSVLRDIS